VARNVIVVNFTNNLRAALAPIFFCQKNAKTKVIREMLCKTLQKTEKLLVKCWWNWYKVCLLRRYFNSLWQLTNFSFWIDFEISFFSEWRFNNSARSCLIEWWEDFARPFDEVPPPIKLLKVTKRGESSLCTQSTFQSKSIWRCNRCPQPLTSSSNRQTFILKRFLAVCLDRSLPLPLWKL